VREQLIKRRTALANQIRRLRCIVVAQATARLRRVRPLILEETTNGVSGVVRELVGEMVERLRTLDDRLRQYDRRVKRICRKDERWRRSVKVEGVGPPVATALVAPIGNARHFKNGRELSAWLGRVPCNSPVPSAPCCSASASGSDRYLRTLFIHGARAASWMAGRKRDARSIRVSQLNLKRQAHVAAAGLANKNARVMWALLPRGGGSYRVRPAMGRASAA